MFILLLVTLLHFTYLLIRFNLFVGHQAKSALTGAFLFQTDIGFRAVVIDQVKHRRQDGVVQVLKSTRVHLCKGPRQDEQLKAPVCQRQAALHLEAVDPLEKRLKTVVLLVEIAPKVSRKVALVADVNIGDRFAWVVDRPRHRQKRPTDVGLRRCRQRADEAEKQLTVADVVRRGGRLVVDVASLTSSLKLQPVDGEEQKGEAVRSREAQVGKDGLGHAGGDQTAVGQPDDVCFRIDGGGHHQARGGGRRRALLKGDELVHSDACHRRELRGEKFGDEELSRQVVVDCQCFPSFCASYVFSKGFHCIFNIRTEFIAKRPQSILRSVSGFELGNFSARSRW